METTALLNKLNAKLEGYKKKYDEVNNNPQFRNIAFGAAGYLSKASKNRLYSFREQLGRWAEKVRLTEICIKIVKGESFAYTDIMNIANICFIETNPELVDELRTGCFRLSVLKEMINYTFERYSVAYRKQVLKYSLKYTNDSGYSMDIALSPPTTATA